MENSKQQISIIIPNYNGEAYIKNCLNSLITQTMQNNEIIVIDDCSSDTSVELIQNYPEVKLYINSENSGFATSVNNGIRASHGEYIILLNNDVVVESDFVEQLYRAMVNNDTIFSISSRMVRYYERDKLDDAGDFYHVLGWAYKRGDGKSIENLLKPTKVFSTCAGAGMYRKSVFDEIGLFDENFFAYLEDVDVSYRGLIHGYENWYEPNAICYHIGSATTADGNKYSPFKVKISARNNIYLIYKNMPPLQIVFNSPFLLTGFAIKGATFFARGYGKEYSQGIIEGIRTMRKLKRTKYKKQRTLNYLKIEAMLLSNIARHIKDKSLV